MKRAIDIAGSGGLLLLLSPVLASDCAGHQAHVQGPVMFEQERLGQFGERFKCLKFRTMHVELRTPDSREYVQQFIAGKADADAGSDRRPDCLQDHERSARDPGRTNFCARRASMNSRNSGTFCVARCRWWVRGRRFHTNSKCTTSGTAAEFLK